MGFEDSEISSDKINDSDANSVFDDDDEYCFIADILKDSTKARWNDEMGISEVVKVKGRMLTTTGITCNGKVYFSIEETLFLAQVGALILLNDDGTPLPLATLYERIASGRHGCTWENFEPYRHLKTLGYIVGRHSVPWSVKSIKSNSEFLSSPSIVVSNALLNRESKANSIVGQFNSMQINEARPLFDVYPPNSKFRKTAPGNPSFILCSTSGHPPSKVEIESIEIRSNGIPLIFYNVEHGRVSYCCFNKVEHPILP